MCALLAVKAVSLDCEGKGIEMEAGRPGWNDSMNGLPGLFGSSTCETGEAARLAAWLLDALPEFPDTALPGAVADLVARVAVDLEAPDYDWDRAASMREAYRAALRRPGAAEMRTVTGADLRGLLQGIERRMRAGVEAATDAGTQLVHTYFRARAVDPAPICDEAGLVRTDAGTGSPLLEIGGFELTPLPLFLEGQVHLLRLLAGDEGAARRVYESVRASGAFDEPLQMYKLSECLADEPDAIGRASTFSRGWFENESVWLHMSYKYLIELLRCGLYEEFFRDAETMLVPFMDPGIYGRSVLENSSFIAPSVNPDPDARGRGFIARLTGSTAEFIHIWVLMTAGPRPFRMDAGRLRLQLEPALPGGWFTTEPRDVEWRGEAVSIPADSLACAFLGDVLLVYRNPERRNTFGEAGARPVRYVLDGDEVAGSAVAGEPARRVRGRHVSRIDAWLG
jgi:hypothetical protein